MTNVFIIFSAFLLGLRHGLDFDHLAAITDITGSGEMEGRRGLVLGTLYALGHAAIILILGWLAIFIGLRMPEAVDELLRPFVGITLILLSFWVSLSLIRSLRRRRGVFRPKSRWMIIFSIFNRLRHSLHKKIGEASGTPSENEEGYSLPTAFAIGLIHGIGAETPTQIILFATAAGVTGKTSGNLILLSFVFGLLTSNSVLVILSNLGYHQAVRHPKILAVVGLTTAAFSLIVGILFLTGRVGVLPVIFGGG